MWILNSIFSKKRGKRWISFYIEANQNYLEVSYNGPGYTRDIRRPLTLVQFSEMPVMPLTPLDHVSAIHRLNELFGANNKVKVVPAECVTGVILEGVDELYENLVK